ncbi:MAG TPA: GxxExxY protein [Pirellulales bacterium]|nr:GxxExxY protein [Pirellulales bacterium]
MELIYKDEAYAIIGACFEVHNEVGYGFGEPIYQECLTLELALREIPFRDCPFFHFLIRVIRVIRGQTRKGGFGDGRGQGRVK